MAAIHCVQALRFPSRTHVFFPSRDQNRYNNISKKQRGFLVFASADKNSVKEIYIKSKVETLLGQCKMGRQRFWQWE
uniref:Uncharacterized protein n=1 Tax=Salix viminalis TaxID=40686 RepID=A0A6N2NCY9_SALVM